MTEHELICWWIVR